MKKKYINNRIGNIEIIPYNYEGYSHEIVKWYPNEFYGHQDEFERSPTDPTMYESREKLSGNVRYRVHESCFKNPESCYVVAFITDKEEPDVMSVGTRPWDLDAEDEKAFREVLRMVFEENGEEDE